MMAEWNRYTPKGVSDILPDECKAKKDIESTIWSVFSSMGYREVELPTFEYYDVYSKSGGPNQEENTFKFFDEKGRILALRPDITSQIARMAATKEELADLPKRYCYTGNVFRTEETQGARQREFTQAGIELLGSSKPEADAEVIAASIEAVLAVGIEEFSMEIGQVAFFNGLVEQAGLTKEQTEILRERIDAKDSLGISDIVADLPIEDGVKKVFIDLPNLFGGEEIIERANVQGLNEKSKAALENLGRIFDLLVLYGFEKYVSIDLGMLQSIDYYTGTIFKCYTKGVGFPILAGGRYDNLVANFGKDIPAVGAAIGIGRIMSALRFIGKGTADSEPKTVIFAENNAEGLAYDVAYTLRVSGCLVEGYIGDGDIYACEKYVKNTGASALMRVFPNGVLQIKDFKKDEITETTVNDFLGYVEEDEHEHHHGEDCGCGSYCH
ncbi:MAG: ATP phosphoribosyltransferase regulatory subunit [Clostridia bacterium]|nr:ATP phosphoribosyltransferase regulatory subunit [Clostridia bacterium]